MAFAAPAEALEEKVRQARRLAPYNLAAHAWLLHRDDRDRRLAFAAHHQVIAAYLQARERYPYLVIVAPPAYAKTTLALTYATWRIGASDGRLRLAVISGTATQAESFARATERTLQSEEYQETYPKVRRDPARRWTSREMFFTETPEGPNPGLFAAGLDGPILGKRFDEVVLDDVTTWTDARSEQIMEGQRQKILGTLIQRFPAGARPPYGDGSTRMVVLCTRWSERDLVPLFRDDLRFHVLWMPGLGYWDRLVTCSECGKRAVGKPPCEHDERGFEFEFGRAALWPEKEPRDVLEAMREHDELTFELIYQGNAGILAGDIFDSSWFRRGEVPGRFDMVVMGFDSAGGRDARRGDFAACVVLGFRGEQVWVIHAWRDRVPATTQERKIIDIYEEMKGAGWTPEMVYVERKNEGGAIIDHLEIETRLPIRGVDPVGDKQFRAVPLANAYRRGAVWHPERATWVRPFEAELEAFGVDAPHDDFIDAATIAYNETEHGGARGPRLRVLG